MTEQGASATPRGYETRDTRVGPLVALGVGLVVLVLGALAVTAAIVSDKGSREGDPHPMAGARGEPPGPRLQAAPTLELDAYLAREREQLSRYEWVDREAGIARIPIERAIEIVIEREAARRDAPEEGQ